MATPDRKKSNSSTVHSVVVTVKLLEFLATSGRPQRVTDIATSLKMTKARVSRHLSTLTDLGLVARLPDNSGYRLGPALFRLSRAALDQYEITNIAYRYMVVLRNEIDESLLLAIPAGGDALIVSSISSNKTLGPRVVRGTRWTIPMSPTARLILAYSSDHIRERILARRSERNTDQELAFDASDMRSMLETIRNRFYEYDANAHDAGFATVTVPIFDHSEELQAALTVVMASRGEAGATRSEDIRYLQPLRETGLELTRALGSIDMANKMATMM
ncbi:MAG: IclR family transcriptional regulator [Proteobacteria bacterium]|nr:IclR family transcriptional regulator [Pseudomonadota bacterium]